MSAFSPERHDDYAPHPVQREFIRLCALRYHYLALGDTDHTRPAIRAFALNPATVDALEEAGKSQYFLELAPENQYYLDYLRRDEAEKRRRQSVNRIEIDRLTEGRESLGGVWLDRQDTKLIAAIFEKSARQVDDLHFVAADQRLRDPQEMEDTLRRVSTSYRRETSWNRMREKHPGLTGTAGGWRDRLAKYFINHPIQNISPSVYDDTGTAAYVRSFTGPAAFFYGAYHFDEAENEGGPACLGMLLKEDGAAVCVLNIYDDDAHRAEAAGSEGGAVRAADAELLAVPGADDPYGVKINNPALLPLLEQAVRGVYSAGFTPQDTTFQPRPS